MTRQFSEGFPLYAIKRLLIVNEVNNHDNMLLLLLMMMMMMITMFLCTAASFACLARLSVWPLLSFHSLARLSV